MYFARYLIAFCFATSLALAGELVVPHITQPSNDFQTTLYISNNSNDPEEIVITPFNESGGQQANKSLNVPANRTLSLNADVFFGNGVSHFRYDDLGVLRVSVGYQGRVGSAILAHVTPPLRPSTQFALPQSNVNYAFDSLAVVNGGSANTSVTITQFRANGQQVAAVEATSSLAPMARKLVLLNSLFSAVNDSYYVVSASQPLYHIALGGTLSGAANPALFQGLTQTRFGGGGKRWFSHITSTNGTFKTQLILTNPTGAEVSIKLNPYLADGTVLAVHQRVLPAYSTTKIDPDTLANHISHIALEEGEVVAVRVAYSRRDQQGISTFLEPMRLSKDLLFLEGNINLTWDGFALMNPAGTLANFKLEYFSSNGQLKGTLNQNLGPLHKQLLVPSQSFTLESGGYFRITSDIALAVTALRGNQDSTVLFANRPSCDFMLRRSGVELVDLRSGGIQSLNGDQLTLALSGGATPPAVGSIIAGDEAHPFLRKVVSITPQGNGLYVAQTQIAPLTDLIQDGSLIASSPPQDLQQKIEPDAWQADFSGSASLSAKASGTFSSSLQPQLEYRISDSHSEYLMLGVEGSLEVVLKGELEGRLDGSATFSRDNLINKTLGATYHMVGWIPIFIAWDLQVDAVAEFTGSVSADVTWTSKSNYTASAGVEFELQPEFNVHPTYTIPTPQLQPFSQVVQITADVTATFHLIPKFHARIVGILGPSLGIDAYTKGFFDFIDSTYDLGIGLKGTIGGELNPLFFGEGYSVETEIFDKYWPLVSGSFAGVGQIQGLVRVAGNNTLLEGVTITVTKTDDPTLLVTAVTGADGSFTTSLPAGSNYQASFSKTGYLTETYNNLEVIEGQTTFLEPILQIDVAQSGNGSAAGQIINALDGTAVAGLLLEIRAGINTTNGPVLFTTSTNSSGNYLVSNLPAGNYTVSITAAGYQPTSFRILILGNQTLGNQNGTVTPLVGEGETRIILTWGANPSDLDSYLSIPTGVGRAYIYYIDQYFEDANTRANLDRDDITSYGPETITIERQGPGVFRYFVHDFSNSFDTSSTWLSNSNAQVRVVRGNTEVALFNVPSNRIGTVWSVFELEGNTIRPVNTLGFEADIQKRGDQESFPYLRPKAQHNDK